MKTLLKSMFRQFPDLGPMIAFAMDDAFYAYDIGTWTQRKAFESLSCGSTHAPTQGGRLQVLPDMGTEGWFVMKGPNGVGVYDMADGSELYLSGSSWIYGGCMAPDGSFLVIGDNSSLKLVRTSDWTEGTAFTHGLSIYPQGLWNRDSSKFCMGNYGGDFRIFEEDAFPTMQAFSAAFSVQVNGRYTRPLIYGSEHQGDTYDDEIFGAAYTAGTDDELWRLQEASPITIIADRSYSVGMYTVCPMDETHHLGCRVGTNAQSSGVHRIVAATAAWATPYSSAALGWPSFTVQGIVAMLNGERAFAKSDGASSDSGIHEFDPVTLDYVGKVIDSADFPSWLGGAWNMCIYNDNGL